MQTIAMKLVLST